MTLYDYLMLTEKVQTVTLASNGEYVATLDNGGTFYELYSLSVFFVELEYEKWTKKLVGRAIFQSGLHMEKYLPDTKISI